MHCRRDAIFLNMVFQEDFITVAVTIKEHAPCFFLKFSFSGRDLKCGSFSLHKHNEISLSNKYTFFFSSLEKVVKSTLLDSFFPALL